MSSAQTSDDFWWRKVFRFLYLLRWHPWQWWLRRHIRYILWLDLICFQFFRNRCQNSSSYYSCFNCFWNSLSMTHNLAEFSNWLQNAFCSFSWPDFCKAALNRACQSPGYIWHAGCIRLERKRNTISALKIPHCDVLHRCVWKGCKYVLHRIIWDILKS